MTKDGINNWGKFYQPDVVKNVRTGDRVRWHDKENGTKGVGIVTYISCTIYTITDDKTGELIRVSPRHFISVQQKATGEWKEYVGY